MPWHCGVSLYNSQQYSSRLGAITGVEVTWIIFGTKYPLRDTNRRWALVDFKVDLNISQRTLIGEKSGPIVLPINFSSIHFHWYDENFSSTHFSAAIWRMGRTRSNLSNAKNHSSPRAKISSPHAGSHPAETGEARPPPTIHM